MTTLPFKGTPGPWTIEKGEDERDFVVTEPTGNTVAETNTALFSDASDLDEELHQITLEEALANSALIAAAYDLVSLLWDTRDFVSDNCSFGERRYAALKKAGLL